MTEPLNNPFLCNMIVPLLWLGLSFFLNVLPSAVFQNFIFCGVVSFSLIISLNFISFFILPYSPLMFMVGYFLCLAYIGFVINKKREVPLFVTRKVKIWIASLATTLILIFCGTGKRIFEGYYEGHDIIHYAKLAKNMVQKNDLLIKYRNHNHDSEIKEDKHPPLFTTIVATDFLYSKDKSFISDFRFSKITILLSWILLILTFPFLLLKNQSKLDRTLYTLAFLFSFPIFKLFVDFHIDATRLLYIVSSAYLINELSDGSEENGILFGLLVWFLVLGALIHSIGFIWGTFCLGIYFIRNSNRLSIFKCGVCYFILTSPWYFLEYFLKGKL